MFQWLKKLFKPSPYPTVKNGVFQGSSIEFRKLNSQMQELLPMDTSEKYDKLFSLYERLKRHERTYGDSQILNSYNTIFMIAVRKFNKLKHYT